MKYPLRSVIFEVTRECNLSCLYCYNHWRRTGEPVATAIFSKVHRTLSRILKTFDCRNITFTGGEPLLTDGLAELVLKSRMAGKNVTLISNGTAGPYEQLYRCGVALFELPLLAASPDVHDQLTCVKGSHEKVIDSLSTLKKLEADICTVFVLTKLNCSELLPTLHLAKRLGIKRVMLARFNIGGRGIANCEKLLPSIGELASAFAIANNFAQANQISISANVCMPRCTLPSAEYPHIRISACAPSTDRRPITIDGEGNVRICNHSPNSFGNIHLQTPDTLFASAYCNEWRTAQPVFCRECTQWDTCGGGCRAASEQLGQSLCNEDPAIGKWQNR